METNTYGLVTKVGKRTVESEVHGTERSPIGYGGVLLPAVPIGTAVDISCPNDAWLLRRIGYTASHLASESTSLFRMGVVPGGVTGMVPTKLGRVLLDVCAHFDVDTSLWHRQHWLDPRTTALFIALRHWCNPDDFRARHDGCAITPGARETLNRIARFVRRVYASSAFKARVEAEERLSQRNSRRACNLVASMFGCHETLLFVRVDLYFWGTGSAWADERDAALSFDRLTRCLRSGAIADGVLATIARRDEGPARTICYRLMVIADKRQYRDATVLADAVGTAWETRCSQGRGSWLRCCSREDESRCRGAGAVRVSDWRRLIGVRSALRELTKPWGSVTVHDVCRRGPVCASAKRPRAGRAGVQTSDRNLPIVLRILGPI